MEIFGERAFSIDVSYVEHQEPTLSLDLMYFNFQIYTDLGAKATGGGETEPLNSRRFL